MKRFVDDAVRWEAGELSLDQLEARHPGRDVRVLAELSGRLAAIAEATTPDPEASWQALRDELPVRLWTAERVRKRFRRSFVAAAAAAALAGTSIAYAAGVAPVRDQVDHVARTVMDLFSGEDAGNHGNVDQGNAEPSGNAGSQGPDQEGNADGGGPGTSGDQGGSGQSGADQGGQDGGGSDGDPSQGEQGAGGEQGGSDQSGSQGGGGEHDQGDPGEGS